MMRTCVENAVGSLPAHVLKMGPGRLPTDAHDVHVLKLGPGSLTAGAHDENGAREPPSWPPS